MYDQAFFDQDLNRRGTACEKWDGLEARLGREMNPMWVADMDFACPEEVTRALVRRAAHPAYGYTEVTAQSTRAMLDFMRRRHGLDLSPQEQIMLPCVISGLRAAVLALTEPGDAVIVQPPVYGPFYRSVEENGRRVAACPLRRLEGGRYEMDLASVEAACKAGARLMMLCSPHNPVGRCWTEEELRALMALLARYEAALVSDEIHEDFVFAPAAFVPALRLAAGGVPAVRVEFPRNRARWREPRKPRAIQRFAHGFFAFDAAHTHIFGNAEGIQARILKRHGELRAQGIELVGAIGPSIQENLARLWIVQPQKQLYERGFARAVFAHQRDAFSPAERERNARERGALCAGIGEPYIL